MGSLAARLTPTLSSCSWCLLILAWAADLESAAAQTGVQALEIHQIQGTGPASPFVGQVVVTRDNVVTAVSEAGFFMQTPEERADGDPDSSDGLFVFTGGAPPVSVGEKVDVSGRVREFFGLTELSDPPSVIAKGPAPLPAPVPFNARRPSPDPASPSCAIEYECYEGMRVAIAGGAVSGPNQRFRADPFAEVHVTAAPARAFRESGVAFPGLMSATIPTWDGNPEVFELDPDRLGLANRLLAAGSSFDAVGVLSFEFGDYELWPTGLEVRPATLPRAVRARGAGELTIGTLNLLRLFDDLDDPPVLDARGGAREDQVVSEGEYRTRRWKLARYIVEVLGAPDILAVQEAEKIEVLSALADGVTSLDPSLRYTPHLIEGNDRGSIDVGFLVRDTVRVSAVLQLGRAETLSMDGSLLHDRPPLLLDADYTGNGAPFRILTMVVHMRSLTDIEDPAGGDRVRRKRLEQAESIARAVRDLQQAVPSVPLVVLGDFNAFEFTDGFVDVVGLVRGRLDPDASLLSGPDLVDPDLTDEVERMPPEERYSYVFRGSAQALDHALTSRDMAPWVRGAAFGRGNADAAAGLIDDAATGLRASDHDGLVLYVMSDGDADGVPEDLDRCPGTKIPESVPTVKLGAHRHALIDSDGVFDTPRPRGTGAGDRFTLADTAGCACGQIVGAMGLGRGPTKFGCGAAVMRRWVEQVARTRGGGS